jgi:hypothetical protein
MRVSDRGDDSVQEQSAVAGCRPGDPVSTSANHWSGRSFRRRGIIAVGVATFAGAFVAATAVPAWAHRPLASGRSMCSDGDHTITWSIGNSETNLTMHIASAVATRGTRKFGVTGYSDVAGHAKTSAQTIVPGALTGDHVVRACDLV